MTGNWLRGLPPDGPDGPAAPKIDTSVAHSARVYNYLLGGKDYFAPDRDAGDRMIEALPLIVAASRANRAFLARAVRYLTAGCGIRQFLDIGTGIPSASNTHEVAQEIAPESRIVYADTDPIVLAHARALLTSTPEGATAYLGADLRDSATILTGAAATLDFSQPIALMLLLILHMIPDGDDPHAAVARIVQALPSGSYLVISHPPSDLLPAAVAQVTQRLNERMGEAKMTARSHAEVARFFDGLELAEPGIVQTHQWRPADGDPAVEASMWCGVARKP